MATSPDARIPRALELLAGGQLEAALAVLDELLADDPDARHGTAVGRVVRGLVLLDQSRFTAARADFTGHTEAQPDDPAGWLGLGRALAGEQSFGRAVVAFSQALRLRPEWGDAHWHRAASRAAVQDLGGAVEDLDAALRFIAPHARGTGREARICYMRAQLRLMAEDRDGAREDFIRAAALWDARGDTAWRDRVVAVAKALGL